MKLTEDQESELSEIYFELESIISDLSRVKHRVDDFFDRHRDKRLKK